MNTLAPHPNPEAQAWQPHELAEPQDPWGEMPDHSGDLAPLPHMSPTEEAAAFEHIADDLRKLPQPQDPWSEATAPTSEPYAADHDDHREYTPRHLRLNEEEPFTSTPATDIARRNQAKLQTTLALRETLGKVEPKLLAEAREAAAGERPADYKGRRRKLGRFARLFSR